MITTTNQFPNVPLPAGAVGALDWYSDDEPMGAPPSTVAGPAVHRYFRGSSWAVERTDGLVDYFCVQVDGTQRSDGTVLKRQVVLDDIDLTTGQARLLAQALLEAGKPSIPSVSRKSLPGGGGEF
jgi:hypothetical protein